MTAQPCPQALDEKEVQVYFLRRFLVALMLLMPLAVSLPSAGQAASYPDIIPLPDGWLPEGIATGEGSEIFAGSRRHGAIYRADLRTGEGEILVPPQMGRIAVGLAYDSRSGYIFAAGGNGGALYVYDSRTGEGVAAFDLTDAPMTFINDVVVTRDAAYVTDSFNPVIHRIPLGPAGRLPPEDAAEEIPLSGDYQHVAGFNLNGIEATRNGTQLIVVQSSTGKLFKVDAGTGVASAIDLDGYSVSAGDGLLIEGRTLYVVRNQLNLVAEIRLSRDLLRGELVQEITNPAFDIPTTAAGFGRSVYVVNARFTSGNDPSLEYDIVGFRP
jgi:sugar lactone lactonase YvrE